MLDYHSSCVRELAAQFQYAPRLVRARFARRIEDLLPDIDLHRDYPGAFVAFRVTGFEGEPNANGVVRGEALRADLAALLDEVSRELRQSVEEADDCILTLAEVSERCCVCARTLRRWRHARGLPLRWFLFANGRLRLGVRESCLRLLMRARPHQMRHSARFSRLSAVERQRVIQRARKVRDETGFGITEVSRRVAELVGRAPETVRYTIRSHDRENAEAALFGLRRRRLTLPEREQIALLHAAGVPVPELCRRYGKSRSVIYAAIQAAAVARALSRRIRYVPSEEFEFADAEDSILGAAGFDVPSVLPAINPDERDPDLFHATVSQIPVLSRERERDLFRRYNYVKFRMARLQDRMRRHGYEAAAVRDLERMARAADVLRRDLISSNLRLVAAVARRHTGPLVGFQDLMSSGSVVLMRAVERFDYTRGTKFSTYATWAITKEYARTIPEENYRLSTFVTGRDELLRSAGTADEERGRVEALSHLRHLLDQAVASLTTQEREVIRARFGLEGRAAPMTLREVGGQYHLTAERIRQIQNKALAKLRTLLGAEGAESLSA